MSAGRAGVRGPENLDATTCCDHHQHVVVLQIDVKMSGQKQENQSANQKA
jgi:hypothetical protein